MGGPRRGGGVFRKPPLSSSELIDLMIERGLEVADRDVAARTLFLIGYYRLQPYSRGFEMPGTGHRYREGVSFEDLLDRYTFDRRLRLLVLDGLARIEVAYRAALSEVMSQVDGDPHWYLRSTLFGNASDHKILLGNVQQAVDQPHPALEEYLTRYRSPELPPSWLMVEVLSLGQLSRVFRALRKSAHKEAVAQSLGLTAAVLENWLESFVRVRNICAHHERLWDATLPSHPMVPPEPVPWPRPWSSDQDRTLHAVAAAVASLLHTVAPMDRWGERLVELVAPRSEAEAMGFRAGWVTEWWSGPGAVTR